MTEEALLALVTAGVVKVAPNRLIRAPFNGSIATPPLALRGSLLTVSAVAAQAAAAVGCPPEDAAAALAAAGVPIVRVGNAAWGGEYVVRAAAVAAGVAAEAAGVGLHEAAAELGFALADIEWMVTASVLVPLEGGGSVTRRSIDTVHERLYPVHAMAADVVRACPDAGMEEADIAAAIEQEVETAGRRCCVAEGKGAFLERSAGESIVADLIGQLRRT